MKLAKRKEAASELLALAEELGIDLPMPIEKILAWEEEGATVDLLTGEVTLGGANERVTVTEAVLEAMAQEVV